MEKSLIKKIIIVGGGPAGMMAALELSKNHEVHLYEKGKTLGRKFLVAGKGGFNLSNSLTGQNLISKYSPTSFFTPILNNFDSCSTRNWLKDLGINTFIGSSGRIFPIKGIKPIEVLNAIKDRLLEKNATIHFEHEFIDFTENEIIFKTIDGSTTTMIFDKCIFALGGASWSATGSKGDWLPVFEKIGIATKHFEASNCGLKIDFTHKEILKHIGTPLKNIQVSINGITIKGEAVISNYGLEGNAIYPISALVRENLKTNNSTQIKVDLKPFNTELDLLDKITATTLPKNYSYLFKLNKTQIALIKSFTDKETYLNPISFVKSIKNLYIPITNLQPMEEAISTIGGISMTELNPNLSLKKIPNVYIAGEMFDWDTITGGFLLQGCFSTAYHISQNIINTSN
ncbi:TIGR03862 family flavoprotein [Flavicella sp.]|uniref:NAD(P)/FAD-dependent oxidoreductase n=1 Tax=Flavicella sp. TaxID=2957742 RepID=UPI0030187550